MPASIKLQEEYGDDLQVLFVECQGADLDTAEAFAWRQKWMGTQALWSTERPLEPDGNGLPACALLDTEGKVLFKGNPLDLKKQIEEGIAAQVKKAKDPPAGTPAKLAKPWATFVKGGMGAALVECDKLGAADASLTEAAKTLHAQMFARAQARIERAKWLIENGYVAVGRDTLVSLSKAVAGSPELTEAIADPLAKVLIDSNAAVEVTAMQALTALQQKMTKGKPFDDGNVKALAKLSESYRGTKAAEQAAHLVKLAKLKFE